MVNAYEPDKSREIGVKMSNIVNDNKPVYQRARRLSEAKKREVNTQVDEWLREGIVRESHSDYASPVVMVKKKNGSTRLCVDYRLLNKKIVEGKSSDRRPARLVTSGEIFFGTD